MTTNYPNGLDSFVNPLPTNQLNSPSHASQHDNINDAMLAVQAKVGVTNSSVTSSLDYKVNHINPTSIVGVVPVSQGGTGLSSVLSGNILVGNGTSVMGQVTSGALGGVLTSNGPGINPSFQTANNSQTLVTLTAVETIAPQAGVSAAIYASQQVQVDNKIITSIAGSGSVNFSSVFSVGNNINRALLVMGFASTSDGSDGTWVGTYASSVISFTQITQNVSGNDQFVAAGILVNPPIGNNTLHITGSHFTGTAFSAYSLYNVNQSTPIDSSLLSVLNNFTSTPSMLTGIDGTIGIGTVFATATIPSVSGNLHIGDTQSIPIAVSGSTGTSSTFGGSTALGTGTSLSLSQSAASGPFSWVYASIIPSGSVMAGAQNSSSGSVGGVRSNGFIGFSNSNSSVATGQSFNVATAGVVSSMSGITSGSQYYLASALGTISKTPGTATRKVGIGINNSEIVITNIW